MVLVKYEMQWMVRYFIKEAKKWKEISMCDDISSGAKAYAARQAASWACHAVKSDQQFKLANPEHVTLVS
jgi:hypothetical protein